MIRTMYRSYREGRVCTGKRLRSGLVSPIRGRPLRAAENLGRKEEGSSAEESGHAGERAGKRFPVRYTLYTIYLVCI
jgi:hypothetical protein